MLWTIIKKELLGNLVSLRFILTLILIVTVFVVSGFVFVGKYREEIVDYREIANKNLSGLNKL